jgi:integrase
LLYTGLRLGEALALHWDAIDLNARTPNLTVSMARATSFDEHRKPIFREPKNPWSRRTISLDAATVAALDAHRKAQLEHYLANGIRPEHDLVFANEIGNGLSHHQAERAWGSITKRAGIKSMTVHQARHWHASDLFRQGFAITVVSKRLGHKNPKVTLAVYARALDGSDDEVAERINARSAAGGL